MALFPLPPPPLGRRSDLNVHNARQWADKLGAPAATLRFFAALNDCISADRRCHPLVARDVGILAACRQWLSNGVANDLLTDLADPSTAFTNNVEALCQTIENDPLYRQGRIVNNGSAIRKDAHPYFATAGMMFWARPHAIIEMTDALERMLIASDLGDGFMEALQAPLPACFVRFGKAFQEALAPGGRGQVFDNCRPQGAYVFDRNLKAGGGIGLVLVLDLLSDGGMGIEAVDLVLTARGLISGIPSAQGRPYVVKSEDHMSSVQALAKVLLYLGSEQAIRIEERPYSEAMDKIIHLGPKKAAKLQRQLPDLYDRILLGPNEIPAHVHGEVSPHLRRGHFRMQPHGPQNLQRKVMFIAPTWVRADKLVAPGRI